jgi:ATP-dependent DNA helicase RecG
MVEVKMIDTMGYGIFRMTKSQRKRYLPLPDYAKSTSSHVHLDVLGRPIDLNYSELLLARSDLELDTVILLDRIQKKLPITDDAIKSLRKAKLIEGNRPNIHVAASVAQATGTEASYTQAKGVDSVSLKAIILDHLRKFPGTNRPALDQLLTPMLSKGLTDKQKKDKITNLLSAMKRDGTITIEGKGPGAKWFRA